MDSFELNKLIGALLGVVFVVFSVSLASEAIFASHAPETPGYAIEVPDEPAGGGAPADTGPTALDLLASADPAAGESAFRRCASCHTVEQGGANRVGPNLWGIVGRAVAEHEGFSYSAAMETYSEGATKPWEFENLSHFLVNPRSYIPGTTMAFAGIRDPQEEANLIAYLNQQSDNRLPLPEPAPAADEAAEGEEAPADDAAAPAEDGDAAPATDEAAPADGEEAAPAGDEAAPADDGEIAPADEDGAVTNEAGQETEAAPVEPTPEQDGTEVSPETDAGQPAADGQVTDEEPRTPGQD